MGKKEKGKKNGTKKDFEQLKEEIEQKGKEIEHLKKTVEEMRTQIQGKEEIGETEGLGKIFDDVSELLDVSFSIFGTSGKVQGEKSKGKGLFGLINDLAKLSEKSETYQKKINLGGKEGIIDFRVSSRPIRKADEIKPTSHLNISKPKKEASPTRTPIPPTVGSIKEREPMVDIFEEKDQVRVMAELPGVEEKDINLDVKKDTLTISADTSATKYHKKVTLPTSVKSSDIESTYRNGILEIKMWKAKEERKKQ